MVEEETDGKDLGKEVVISDDFSEELVNVDGDEGSKTDFSVILLSVAPEAEEEGCGVAVAIVVVIGGAAVSSVEWKRVVSFAEDEILTVCGGSVDEESEEEENVLTTFDFFFV